MYLERVLKNMSYLTVGIIDLQFESKKASVAEFKKTNRKTGIPD